MTREVTTLRKFYDDKSDTESEVGGLFSEVELNLEKDLFSTFCKMIVISPDDKFTLEDENVFPKDRGIPADGTIMFIDFDDFAVAVYRNGQPIAGMYESYRGRLHQAGAYIVKGEKFFYAHNMPGISFRSENVDMWEETSEVDISASIAQDWLLGIGMFAPKEMSE